MQLLRLLMFFAAILDIFGVAASFTTNNVLGVSTSKTQYQDYLSYDRTLETTTAFDQKQDKIEEQIPFETIYEEDPETEYGVENVIQAGATGVKALTYNVIFWLADEIDRTLISTEIQDPIAQKIAKGTKIVWREFQTPDAGKIKYWSKMRVYATKYDHNCLGCNYTTSIGAYLQKGVCAVDPTVIKYYTHFYVPGYGMCQALDTGGLIKGNRIDVAFDNAAEAPPWSHYVDIYLIDNQPY